MGSLVSINGQTWQTLGCVSKAAATLVNAAVLWTINGGPIMINALLLQCITANDATASTVQFNSTPTIGSAKTISAASASLASATAGSTLSLNATSLATAPDIVTGANGGAVIGPNVANRIIIMPGTLNLVVASGSTTGTWAGFMTYWPMSPNTIVF